MFLGLLGYIFLSIMFSVLIFIPRVSQLLMFTRFSTQSMTSLVVVEAYTEIASQIDFSCFLIDDVISITNISHQQILHSTL